MVDKSYECIRMCQLNWLRSLRSHHAKKAAASVLDAQWNLESEPWSRAQSASRLGSRYVSTCFNKQISKLLADLHTAASCCKLSSKISGEASKISGQCSSSYMLHMLLLVPNGCGHSDFSGLVNFVPKWHFWKLIFFWTNTRLAHQV